MRNVNLGNGRELQWGNQVFRVVETESKREFFRHNGFVFGLSPDKRWFAVPAPGKNVLEPIIRVIDLQTFKDMTTLPFSVSQSLSQLVFTPDSKTIAVQDYQNMTRFCDVASGDLIVEREGLGLFVFAPDGRLLATTNLVGTVDLIDLNKPK